jgi:hypothetical protein
MRRAALLPAALLVLPLAGCAPTVSLTPAPQATSVRCAGVVVRLPDAIDGASRRTTDAQGTAAWGVPASITLTCGVLTPERTTTPCTTVGGVDWLVESKRIDDVQREVATTYGRSPGTRVVIDAAQVSADAALLALAEPILAATRATGVRCLSVSETNP